MGSMATKVQIGDRWVGDGEPCFIVAEAGLNHNRNLEMALRLIDIAVSAKADAVKFQFFQTHLHYPQNAGATDYLKLSKSIYQIHLELEPPRDWVPQLAEYAHQKSLLFGASVFDEELANFCAPFLDFFKIASYEVTHLPLIRHISSLGKPTVMSTGASTLREVHDAVQAFYSQGNTRLCLMHCVTSYPAPLDNLNLRAIVAMKETFGIPVGFSDHSRHPLVGPIAAVALGANLLEKHYTFSNKLPGPDHSFAVEPDELKTMVACIRDAQTTLGTGVKEPLLIENELRQFARRTIFAIKDIQSGEVLTFENTAILRAGKHFHGLAPAMWEQVLGKRVKRAILAETPLHMEDLE